VDVLVTGGTGFLGGYVARALLARGDRVRLGGRDFTRCGDLIAAGAVPAPADVRDADAMLRAAGGIDAVVHSAALSAPWGRRAEFIGINVAGTEHALAAAERAGAGRFVHISSPSVAFDGRDQVDATEAAPYPRRPASHYSWSKQLAEERVAAATKRGLSTVTLRPKAIFGPGDTTLLPRLVAAARAGRLPRVGDGRNRVDLTFAGNVADAVLLALDSTAGGTYTITNGEHPLLWDTIRTLLRDLGIPDRLRPLPLPLALAAATAMEAAAAYTEREPLLTRYAVRILARTQTYDISAARRDLGYAPRVSLAEGLELTRAAWGRG
jgi:nucleoside-diphosphate-sugar epimerase